MRRKKEDAEQTKHLIIEKAVELFLKKGFSQTTLDEIATAAAVTRGAIYFHFKDKKEIVRKLIADKEVEVLALLGDAFAEEIRALPKLKKIIDIILNNFFTKKDFRDFIELTWFKIEYTQIEQLTQSKKDMNEYFTEMLTPLLQEIKKENDLQTDADPPAIAFHISSLIHFIYRIYFIQGSAAMNASKARAMLFNYLELIERKDR